MVGETAAEKTGDGDGTVRENVGAGRVDGGICSYNVFQNGLAQNNGVLG